MSDPTRFWKGLALAVAATAVGGILLTRALEGRVLERARAFYSAQPRYLRPIPFSETPPGISSVRAETCAACHQEIYDEWKISTHARAWEDDAQFQEELAKTRETPGRDAGWMCVNCHTPLEMQLEKLVVGLEDGDKGRPIYVSNPEFDPKLQLEAITCGACHLRDGVILGPYGDTAAPHPVRKAPELLTSQVCTQCHQAKASFPEVNLACVFDTGTELARGAHAGKTCQECHMPEVERPISNMGSLPARKTRRHWFGGSLIPKKPEYEAELAPLRQVYPDGLAARWRELPASIAPGQTVTLTLELENAEAGHMLPTGDPERFLLVKAAASGPDGEVLASLQERIGTVYQWEEPVTKLSDNRLAPKETRRLSLTFEAPSAGPVRLSLTCSKHRLTKENMEYHRLEGRTVAGRTFLDETRQLPVAR